MLDPRDEDLPAVHHVAVASSLGEGLDGGRIRAGVGLGHSEGLQPQVAAGDVWQEALLLLLAAVPQQRAHRVHLGVAGGGVPTGAVDLLEDQAGFPHALAAAAVLLRDQHRQPAGLGQGGDELLWVAPSLVGLAPVLGWKAATQIADCITNELVIGLLFSGGHAEFSSARAAERLRTGRR